MCYMKVHKIEHLQSLDNSRQKPLKGVFSWKIFSFSSCTVKFLSSHASIGSGNIQQLLVTFLLSHHLF